MVALHGLGSCVVDKTDSQTRWIAGRWLIRVLLTAIAFVVGTFAAGLALATITWSQALIDVLGTAAGIAFALLVAFMTKSLTNPVSEGS